jgi:hypothetical protein
MVQAANSKQANNKFMKQKQNKSKTKPPTQILTRCVKCWDKANRFCHMNYEKVMENNKCQN